MKNLLPGQPDVSRINPVCLAYVQAQFGMTERSNPEFIATGCNGDVKVSIKVNDVNGVRCFYPVKLILKNYVVVGLA